MLKYALLFAFALWAFMAPAFAQQAEKSVKLTDDEIKAIIQMADITLKAQGIGALDAVNAVIAKIKAAEPETKK